MKKHFILEVTEIDNKLYFNSEAEGINGFEVLGILEWKKIDVYNQMIGQVKPDIVTRKRIEEIDE